MPKNEQVPPGPIREHLDAAYITLLPLIAAVLMIDQDAIDFKEAIQDAIQLCLDTQEELDR